MAAQRTEGGTDPPLPTAQGRGHPLFIYLDLLSSFLAAGGLVSDRSAPIMVSAAAAAPVWSAFGRVAPGAGPQRPAYDDNPIAAGREWELFGTLLLHAPLTDHVVVVDESSTVTVPQGPTGAPPTHMPTGTVLFTCEGGVCGHVPPASSFLSHIYVREVNYGCLVCGSPFAAGVLRTLPDMAPRATPPGRRRPPRLNTSPCGSCRIARYCSRPCQVASWAGGHKGDCRRWATLYAPSAGNGEHLETVVDTAGPWQQWAWPRDMAAAAKAAGVPLSDMLVTLDCAAGWASLLPAAVYHRLRNAVPAAALASPLKKHDGRVLRVVCAGAPPRVLSYGPRSLGLTGAPPPPAAAGRGGGAASHA